MSEPFQINQNRGISFSRQRKCPSPVAFVVAAEEFALVLAFTHQEQQVAVGGQHVENGDLGLGSQRTDDLEELALAVGLHVQRDQARRAVAPSRAISDLQPSADAGKLDVEQFRVHKGEDTIQPGRFATIGPPGELIPPLLCPRQAFSPIHSTWKGGGSPLVVIANR
ncbi:MAG: hypothetical protein ACRELG_14770 [Gemmataceae bacterium]